MAICINDIGFLSYLLYFWTNETFYKAITKQYIRMRAMIKNVSLLLVLCLYASCNKDNCATKAAFLETFEEFSSEFESKRLELTEDDNAAFEARFKSLIDNCYKKHKAELTLKERQDFWKSGLRYFVTTFDLDDKTSLTTALDDPFNNYVKDEVMELVKESGFSYLTSLQQAVEIELPKLLEMFSTEISKLMEEFSKMLQ